MSHSHREQTYRDLHDSDLRPFDVPTQAERDREADNERLIDLFRLAFEADRQLTERGE